MKKKLYVAYGSNLNLEQMKQRCPFAKLLGTGVIKDYELQFKGRENKAFATIAPKEGSVVPVGVWEIGPMEEKRLDCYEGYPRHYFKQDIPVKMGEQDVNAMVYIMDLKMKFGTPSSYYYQVVHEGYKDCGLDTDVLEQAVLDSTKKYYEDIIGARALHERFRREQVEKEDFEEDELEEDLQEDELDEMEAGFTQGQWW